MLQVGGRQAERGLPAHLLYLQRELLRRCQRVRTAADDDGLGVRHGVSDGLRHRRVFQQARRFVGYLLERGDVRGVIDEPGGENCQRRELRGVRLGGGHRALDAGLRDQRKVHGIGKGAVRAIGDRDRPRSALSRPRRHFDELVRLTGLREDDGDCAA